MLDSVRAGRHFATAIEVGCAEGTCTRQMLAERCESLLATDVSRRALERARALCAGLSHVEFARWDILADSPPRTFELTVVMSVLEPFYSCCDLKVAREKMVALTAPNGYLLLSNTMHGVAEEAWWGRWLIHGANWQDRFIGQHPKLKGRPDHDRSVLYSHPHRDRERAGEFRARDRVAERRHWCAARCPTWSIRCGCRARMIIAHPTGVAVKWQAVIGDGCTI